MDIHQLKVFTSVFKNRSFSRASEVLYLTQPTVSDHIKTLETELDCRLFDRMGRTIIPTKEAEVLYGYAVEIIEKADGIKDVIAQFRKEIAGELIIGASTIPGTYLMPSLMAEFRKKHASISFRIIISDSKEIVEKVLRHEILLGVAGAKLSDAQLNYTPFIQDDLIVVAQPTLIKEEKITSQGLLQYPVVLREEGSGTRREAERILETKGVSFEDMKIACILGSTDAAKQAAKAGLGFTILSKLAVIDELKHKTLKEIRLTDVVLKRQFYFVTHKKRTLPFSYGIFFKYLTAHQ